MFKKESEIFLDEIKIKRDWTFETHTLYVYYIISVTYPDGIVRLISCSYDKTVKVHNTQTRKIEQTIEFDYCLCCVQVAELDDDKNVVFSILVSDTSSHVYIYDLKRGKYEFERLKKVYVGEREGCRFSEVFRIVVMDRGNSFMTCSYDGEESGTVMKCSNIFSGNMEVRKVYNHNSYFLSCLMCSKRYPDEIVFVAGGKPFNLVKIKFLRNGKKGKEIEIMKSEESHENNVNCLNSFVFRNSREERIISSSDDQNINIWSFNLIILKKIFHQYRIYSILWLTECKFILGGKTGRIFVMDTEEKKILKSEDLDHLDIIWNICWITKYPVIKFSTCSDDSRICIFHIEGIDGDSIPKMKIHNIAERNFEKRERIGFCCIISHRFEIKWIGAKIELPFVLLLSS